MSDRTLNSQVARTAQGYKIVRIISNVFEKECLTAVDVMHIKRAASAKTTTETAYFIAHQYRQSDTPPMCTEFKCTTSTPVWMSCAHSRAFSTLMGTKLSTTFLLTGECAKVLSAVFTSQLHSSYARSSTAFKRAMPDFGVPLPVEYLSADSARNRRKRILPTIFGLTRLITELQHRFVFYDVPRALKRIAAIRARERWSINHRRRVTRLTAENSCRSVALKLDTALGACLDH